MSAAKDINDSLQIVLYGYSEKCLASVHYNDVNMTILFLANKRWLNLTSWIIHDDITTYIYIYIYIYVYIYIIVDILIFHTYICKTLKQFGFARLRHYYKWQISWSCIANDSFGPKLAVIFDWSGMVTSYHFWLISSYFCTKMNSEANLVYLRWL